EAVHRYEGYVAQSTGDGIFALFGAPIAHEDHPQRALYAALRMQEEGKKHADNLRQEKGINLQIRVGVNTGEVVLRSIRKDDLHADYTPVGHSTSLASRMESLATPGSIVVSEPTYKLTEGYFEFKSLGAARIKGVSEPINIYEVLGVGPLRTRLQVSARRGLARFIGRQHELEQMRRAFELAQGGHGQVVAVVGEPGVGKSRLCYEFKLISQTGCLVLETFSVSHGKAYPYLPLIDLLKNYFHISPADDERRRREKVMGKVLALDRSLEDTLPYLFALLGIAEPSSSLQEIDPQIKRQRALDTIKRLLLRESLNQPLILLFEDLQWLDAETQTFLTLLSESIATARIFLLVNYRPEYQHSWGSRTYYAQLRLDPLRQEDAQEVLSSLLGEQNGVTQFSPLQPLKHLILEKTEGNPFFIEEIVKVLFDEGVLARDAAGVFLARSVTEVQIPPTVQGVLAARIDRLRAAEKDLLQTLAVMGKEFSLSLLKQVVTTPEESLRAVLAYLQAEEFIYEQPAFPESEFTFKHALTQEVAYHSLLLERRKMLHERTAQGIEGLFGTQLEDRYSELAHHYSHSGNTEKAIKYLQKAGQQAGQRSAYEDAISHLTLALELLKTLPDTPERARQELTLQIALGAALVAIKGYGAPEVARVYTRARELYQQEMGDIPQFLPLLFGLWKFYSARGDFHTAHELAEQLMRSAQKVQDRVLLVPAHFALGFTLFRQGELAAARSHLEQGIALYDPEQHRPDRATTFLYAQDPLVVCLSWASWTLWYLGYPDQARASSEKALSLAHELAHPLSLAFALHFAAVLHRLRREAPIAQERAAATIALASEQGFPYWAGGGLFVHGWALAEQGKVEEGITQMYQGIAAWRAAGAVQLGQPLIVLAEVYGKAGRVQEGLSVLAEALAEVQNSKEHWREAELHRIKGQLTLQSRQVKDESKTSQDKSEVTNPQHLAPSSQAEAEAEACFSQAIEIARTQSAKSLELRAVMSLSRLWQSQGKKTEARQILAETYDWFTEGFDTGDLQEAKALLEELDP
ncbi:MAG TPA: AAA family ATPase, partial [Candidatus Binatia bacterium]|nr:AAA family ATPase [Candidatus Binatia bacterium]